MAPSLFGTDGIRGVANSSAMNTELAVALGRAAASFVSTSEELPRIVIGKDTRRSGYMLETALSSGITSMGLDVIQTGPLPTPGLGFICRSMRARLGIMISASHNPAEQNGIKFFGESGFKLDSDEEAVIERLIADRIPEQQLVPSRKLGQIQQIHDAAGRYVQHLKERLPHRLTLRGMRIAIDAANGAAYRVAPAVFSELGASVEVMGDQPDGFNINDRCGALHPEAILELTRQARADIGITLDGDADRVLLSDEKGTLVDGDAILYICAKHLQAKGHLGRGTVVGTIMTNYGLEEALGHEGIRLIRTDVGDHNVTAHMRAHGINLGGEPCGHLIYLHHGPTGDGIQAALRILSIMRQQGKSLSALVAGLKLYPQQTFNIHVREKLDFDRIPAIAECRRDIERRLEGRGRYILRYSGTEMVARITVESSDPALTKACTETLADAVSAHLGASQ